MWKNGVAKIRFECIKKEPQAGIIAAIKIRALGFAFNSFHKPDPEWETGSFLSLLALGGTKKLAFPCSSTVSRARPNIFTKTLHSSLASVVYVFGMLPLFFYPSPSLSLFFSSSDISSSCFRLHCRSPWFTIRINKQWPISIPFYLHFLFINKNKTFVYIIQTNKNKQFWLQKKNKK